MTRAGQGASWKNRCGEPHGRGDVTPRIRAWGLQEWGCPEQGALRLSSWTPRVHERKAYHAQPPGTSRLGWGATGVSGHTDFPLLCPGDPTGAHPTRQAGWMASSSKASVIPFTDHCLSSASLTSALPLEPSSPFHHSLRLHPQDILEFGNFVSFYPNLPQHHGCAHRGSPAIAAVIPRAPSRITAELARAHFCSLCFVETNSLNPEG